MRDRIDNFLDASVFGVVGASSKPHKYGNKALRCYQMNNRRAIPVNPVEANIEGIDCVKSVSELPDDVSSISIITPPQVTEKVVEQAIAKGITNKDAQLALAAIETIGKLKNRGSGKLLGALLKPPGKGKE